MITERLISPSYTNKFPLKTIENKIAVFVDLVKGWQLDVADDLISHNHRAGYAVMHILMSFIEMMGWYRLGVISRKRNIFILNNGSEEKTEHYKCFENGLSFIFSNELVESKMNSRKVIDLFYYDLRCSLYHTSTVHGRILLSTQDEKPFIFQEFCNEYKLIINPLSFTKYIIKKFSEYVELLSDELNVELRRNFEYSFDNSFEK